MTTNTVWMRLGCFFLTGLSFGCHPEIGGKGKTVLERRSLVESATAGHVPESTFRIRLVRPHAEDPRYPDLNQVVVDSNSLAGRVAESMIFMGQAGQYLAATGGRLFLVISGTDVKSDEVRVKWSLESGGPGARSVATSTELSDWTSPEAASDSSFLYFELNPKAWGEQRLVFPGDRLLAELKVGNELRQLVFYDAGSSPLAQVFSLDRQDGGDLYGELLSEKGYLVGEEKFQNPTADLLHVKISLSEMRSAAEFTVRARLMPVVHLSMYKHKFRVKQVDSPNARVYESDLVFAGVEWGGTDSEDAKWIEAKDGQVSLPIVAGGEISVRYYVKAARQCAELKTYRAPSDLLTFSAFEYPKNIIPPVGGYPNVLWVRPSVWTKLMGGSDLTRVTETVLQGDLTRSIWMSTESGMQSARLTRLAPGEAWRLSLSGKESKATSGQVQRVANGRCRGIPVAE